MALDDGKPSPFLELCALLARESWARQEQHKQQAKVDAINEIAAAVEEVLAEGKDDDE